MNIGQIVHFVFKKYGASHSRRDKDKYVFEEVGKLVTNGTTEPRVADRNSVNQDRRCSSM